jgi:hypothetical protein
MEHAIGKGHCEWVGHENFSKMGVLAEENKTKTKPVGIMSLFESDSHHHMNRGALALSYSD